MTLESIDGWWIVVALARVTPALLVALGGARLGVARTTIVAVAAVVALAIAAFGAPLLAPAVARVAEGGWAVRVAVLGREIGVGVALGVVALVPIAAAQLAGAWVASAVGDEPAGGVWTTATTSLAALVFFALGGHVALIEAIGASYRVLPPAGGASMGEVGATAGSAAFAAGAALFGNAIALAAPLLGATMVGALVIGGIERAAQLGPGALPVEALRRTAATFGLAAMIFALAYALAAMTRGLPLAFASALAP